MASFLTSRFVCFLMCLYFDFGPVTTVMSSVCYPLYYVSPYLFSFYPVVSVCLREVLFIVIVCFLASCFHVLVPLCSDLCQFFLTYVLNVPVMTSSACVLTSDYDFWISSSKTYAEFTHLPPASSNRMLQDLSHTLTKKMV